MSFRKILCQKIFVKDSRVVHENVVFLLFCDDIFCHCRACPDNLYHLKITNKTLRKYNFQKVSNVSCEQIRVTIFFEQLLISVLAWKTVLSLLVICKFLHFFQRKTSSFCDLLQRQSHRNKLFRSFNFCLFCTFL